MWSLVGDVARKPGGHQDLQSSSLPTVESVDDEHEPPCARQVDSLVVGCGCGGKLRWS